jgi:glutathione S-transferase
MKLYDGGRAPNPRRVRIFMAEKGIEIPLVPVDMAALGHRSEFLAARNPLQHLPVLELDDGIILTESVAICRYLEELHPNPALFGKDSLSKAQVEMWNRRMEFYFFGAVAAAFRHLHPAMMEWEKPQVPEWGEVNKPKAIAFLGILDRELASREFVSGDDYSIADITGLVAVDFMKPARIAIPVELKNVLRWKDTISKRPSAGA